MVPANSAKFIALAVIYRSIPKITVEAKLSDTYIKNIISNSALPASNDLQHSLQYGCWCNFRENPYLQRGYGEPVDDFDVNCKQLEENYICCSEEAYNDSNKDNCNPWEEEWDFIGSVQNAWRKYSLALSLRIYNESS